jgi:adenylate cyclase class 2
LSVYRLPHLNIEIKARIEDLKTIRDQLRSLGAVFKGVDHQVDTYFNVNSGRLKLREGNIENHLIYYLRENSAEPKESVVSLYENHAGSNLKDILTKSLGVFVVVDKRREIYFINNVKFHLDEVKGLGAFFEIEATDKDGSVGKDKLLDQCNYYLKIFSISKNKLVDKSYSDLLYAKS